MEERVCVTDDACVCIRAWVRARTRAPPAATHLFTRDLMLDAVPYSSASILAIRDT